MSSRQWDEYSKKKKARKRLQKRLAKPLVFITGCFDLFHDGHLHFLQECAQIGRIHVAINSNKSVKLLKGPTRPKDTWTKRVLAVKATNLVEAVYYLDSADASWFVKRLKPYYVAKGLEDFMDDPQSIIEALSGGNPLAMPYQALMLIPRYNNISTSLLLGELNDKD